MFGETVPEEGEGGGYYGKSSVIPRLSPEWCRQEFGIRGPEAEGSMVVIEQVGKVGGGLDMEDFLSEERDFVMDLLWDREPLKCVEDTGDVVMYL